MATAQVVQPFDGAKFNFTKALQKEVLFQFEAADMPGVGTGFAPMAPVPSSPNLVNALAPASLHPSPQFRPACVVPVQAVASSAKGLGVWPRSGKVVVADVPLSSGLTGSIGKSQVFINVSPIEYGHVLLVPRALDRLQQLVDPASLRLALQFAREAGNPYFRLAFNSLGAYGTVNHLHFQVREGFASCD